LAPKVARQIAATRHQSPERKLLTLPAAGPTHPLQGAAHAGTGGSGVPLLLTLVLVAIAVALIGTAAERRRRRLRSTHALS
jgi:hypothetical protein